MTQIFSEEELDLLEELRSRKNGKKSEDDTFF